MYDIEHRNDGILFFPSVQDVGADHRGWVYGDFVKGIKDTLFEVRLSTLAKGPVRSEWSEPRPGELLTIVTHGSLEIIFLGSDNTESVHVVRSGQMLRSPNSIPHKANVLEDDTSVIAVRSFLTT